MLLLSAWDLDEGDVLVTGHVVTSIHRDPASETVWVGTTEPAQAELPRDGVVPVFRLL